MMTKALAENGAARIYIIGRREEKLVEAASLFPGVVIPLPGDITDQEALKKMAAKVKEEIGYINLLITNAGKSGPMLDTLKPRYTLNDFVALAWSSPMQEFNDTYGLNCTALYYTVIAFLELLDEGNKRKNYCGGKSQVIATASTASFLRNPRAGYAYLSSKAAVISLIKSFSTFCVPWGIRFNTIAAGCSNVPEIMCSTLTFVSVPFRGVGGSLQALHHRQNKKSIRGRCLFEILSTG
jgi:NAD(P)-dependent dehydrogenase (short-subunit alcohol dehydrogenase family)